LANHAGPAMIRHMTNIELFDEYTAKAFAALYEAFPRKIYLDARDLCGVHTVDDFGSVRGANGAPSPHFDVAMATIDWLVETGYLRSRAMDQYGARDAVLTAQGLLVLKASPESLQPKEGVGDRITRFVREGSLALAKDATRAAIGVGVAMMAKGA